MGPAVAKPLLRVFRRYTEGAHILGMVAAPMNFLSYVDF